MSVFTRILRRTLLFGALACSSIAASAQTVFGTVHGLVRDSATAKPIVGASVRFEGGASTQGANTDETGAFHLHAAPGTYSLRVTYLGFKPTTYPVTLVAGQTTELRANLGAAPLSLDEVTVTQTRDLNQTLAAINQVDKELRPTQSAQDLLRLVPGLFIAQHAGGGKAEQIFLRGFDVDHGTDFAVSIDGLPVNMVSHAHGQGYADFHFVIPETVDALNVYKGPYSARFGDFATAGAGEFTTKNEIKQSQVKLEAGQFDTYRALALVDLLHGRHLFSQQKESLYAAGEYYFTNAFFDSPQHLRRFNGLLKYNGLLSENTSLTLLGSHFTSRWDASGQVPERGIQEGLISRFGAIDNTEGGQTDRTNAMAKLATVLPNDAVLTQQAYYVNYHFDLYSNFTFFLRDSVNGDQIRQQERGRNIFGYEGTYEQHTELGARELKSTFGVGTRLDDAPVGLFYSRRRTVLDTVSLAHVQEQNLHAYLDEVLPLTDRLTLNAALRYDYYRFRVRNQMGGVLTDSLSGRAAQGIVSPKLNLYYTASERLQLFVRTGTGFHSNDARGVVRSRNQSLEPRAYSQQRILPRAYGAEVGATAKIGPRVLVNVAFWGLQLQNELVYVGDEGIVEITGRTRRLGTDLALRAQLTNTLYLDADLNYSHGRYLDLPKHENFIPLAPTVTSTGGLTWRRATGFSAALRYRTIDSRPANEDNTVVARGYCLFDAVATYSQPRYQLGFTIENLLNTRWNQAQFATQSRLPGEAPDGVEELHYTPGSPFYLKGNVSVFF